MVEVWSPIWWAIVTGTSVITTLAVLALLYIGSALVARWAARRKWY